MMAGQTSSGSSIQLAARWLIMRCQIAEGQGQSAKTSASLLLASQPNLTERWRARFRTLAE
jgi:hypothetical protein